MTSKYKIDKMIEIQIYTKFKLDFHFVMVKLCFQPMFNILLMLYEK